MPLMRWSNGRNVAGMTRGRQPIMDRGTDRAAPDWRLPGTLVPGDEEDDAIAAGDGLLQRAIDRSPRTVEGHSVKVDGAVGIDGAASKAAVPSAVESASNSTRLLRRYDAARRGRSLRLNGNFRCRFRGFLIFPIAG